MPNSEIYTSLLSLISINLFTFAKLLGDKSTKRSKKISFFKGMLYKCSSLNCLKSQFRGTLSLKLIRLDKYSRNGAPRYIQPLVTTYLST